MQKKKLVEVLEILFGQGQLTEAHLLFLEGLALPETITRGHLISGDPAALDRVFPELERQGLVPDAIELGLLAQERGSVIWNRRLADGDLLLALRDQGGRYSGVLPLSSAQPIPPGPALFGREAVAVSPGELCVVTRDVFTQFRLIESGVVALCITGAGRAGKEDLVQFIEDQKLSPSSEIIVLVEPLEDIGVPGSSATTKGTAASEAVPQEAKAWVYHLARRLAHDGLNVKLVDVPNARLLAADTKASKESVISGLLERAVTPEVYLEQQKPEHRQEILDILGEGKVVSSDGTLTISVFPLRIECSRLKRTSKLKVRLFVAEKECSPDEVNLLERAARTRWVKQMLTQHEELGPQEDTLAFLMEELSKNVAKHEGNGDLTQGMPAPGDGRPLLVLDTTVQVRSDGYWKRDSTTGLWCKFASFTARITEEQVQCGPDGHEERVYIGVAEHDGQCRPFRMTAREFESPRMMEHLGACLGVGKIHSDLNLLRRCIHADSTDRLVVRITHDFGWDSAGRFLTPSGAICAPGVAEPEGERLDLSQLGPAANLDLAVVPDKARLLEATRFLFLQFSGMGDPAATPLLLGFAFVAVVAGWLGDVIKFGVHLFGPSGSLKTVACRALQALFGPAFASVLPLSWTGTPFSLQAAGYGFKDAIAVIDDFKQSTFRDAAGVQVLLQNYADNVGRSRLDRESNLLPPVAFRGWMLSDGEDPQDASSSNTARILPLAWGPKWCSQDLVDRLRLEQRLFSGFTRALVAHLQNLDPLEQRTRLEEAIRRLLSKFAGVANGSRLAQALALNRVSFHLALDCAREHLGALNGEEVRALLERYSCCEDAWCRALESRVRQMEPGKLFLELLTQCIAGAPGMVLKGNSPTQDAIGFVDGTELFLFWDRAVAVVRELAAKSGNPFPVSGDAVLRDLDRTHVLLRKHPNRLKSQARWGCQKLWGTRIPAAVVGLCEEADCARDTDKDDDDGGSQ